MRMKNRIGAALAAFVAAVTFAAPVAAAFIAIDDSNPTTITITAGDFEGGFSVNGSLLTTGLGNSASITLADGGYTIDGTWIDLGSAGGARVDLLFALASNLAFSTSGIEFGATTDGFLATLGGSFGGFVDPSLYFPTGLPTLLQNGQTGFASMPFLSVSFVSEAVPEPGTLALVGLGILALAWRRRAIR